MKRILTVILLTALIFCLCCVQASAASENIPDDDTEILEGSTEFVEPSKEETTNSETEPEKFYSNWIDKITDSTLWINIGSIAVTCLGVIATVTSKFKEIVALVSKKADSTVVIDAVQNSVNDICNSFKGELAHVRGELAEAKDNEEKMMAILTIFMTNVKMNPTAKAEIMSYLTGTKQLVGDISDIVDKANEAIAAAQEAEEKIDTPALDAIVGEESGGYMSLG